LSLRGELRIAHSSTFERRTAESITSPIDDICTMKSFRWCETKVVDWRLCIWYTQVFDDVGSTVSDMALNNAARCVDVDLLWTLHIAFGQKRRAEQYPKRRSSKTGQHCAKKRSCRRIGWCDCPWPNRNASILWPLETGLNSRSLDNSTSRVRSAHQNDNVD